MNIEQKLLNIDFPNKETKERLKSFFKEDIFKDDKDANFVSFLERLQDEIKSGHTEVFKSILHIREKIKKGQLLTQVEIDIAQSLDLHHWKGSNVQGRTFSSMNHVDFRDAKADFTTIKGDLADSIWGSLNRQKIEGNNENQKIEGCNNKQIIEGYNIRQSIKGNNKNQEIKENNENQKIEKSNHNQKIGGNNSDQEIVGTNSDQEIKSHNKCQKIGEYNFRQEIRGINTNQKIENINKDQKIGWDNDCQEIGGNNENQKIGGSNDKQKIQGRNIKQETHLIFSSKKIFTS